MQDPVVTALQGGAVFSSRSISCAGYTHRFKRDHKLQHTLKRGRALVRTPEQSDQYLYNYGQMVQQQWQCYLQSFTVPAARRIHLVDYGCGQASASAMLLDTCGPTLLQALQAVTLIDASQVVLNRAAALMNCYRSDMPVHKINQTFDHLADTVLPSPAVDLTLHVFSNVLDMDSFDIERLLARCLANSGRHVILALSPARQCYGGDQRFAQLKSALRQHFARGVFTDARGATCHRIIASGKKIIASKYDLQVA